MTTPAFTRPVAKTDRSELAVSYDYAVRRLIAELKEYRVNIREKPKPVEKLSCNRERMTHWAQIGTFLMAAMEIAPDIEQEVAAIRDRYVGEDELDNH